MIKDYAWNIRTWIERFDWRLKDTANPIAWLYALLKPVKVKHDELLVINADLDRKVRYNSQQKVFSSVLNDIFDSTLRRIRVVTGTDEVPKLFTYYKSEAATPRYSYYKSEAGNDRFTYFESEQTNLATFIVYAPSALSSDEARLKAWINYYKLADKTYTIIYE